MTFEFTKTSGTPEVTDIHAKYENTSLTPIENFVVQAAVPKFMQLKLEPASGTALPPNQQDTVSQQIHITNSQYSQEVSYGNKSSSKLLLDTVQYS